MNITDYETTHGHRQITDQNIPFIGSSPLTLISTECFKKMSGKLIFTANQWYETFGVWNSLNKE